MKYVLLVLSFCFYFSAFAQHKLVFSKTDSSANVEVELKDNVKLSYNGYMGQPQDAEGIVTTLNDSVITLTPRKKLLQKKQPAQTLYIHDISGFRKYSSFRPAGEIIYGIVGIGIAGTVTTIIGGVSIPAVLGFLSGAATGALTAGLKNAVLSTKIKNQLNNGWTMKVEQP